MCREKSRKNHTFKLSRFHHLTQIKFEIQSSETDNINFVAQQGNIQDTLEII